MSSRKLVAVALGGLAVLLLVARAAELQTEAINWDEFAMLDRAARTVNTQTLHSGGRPGLATLILLPLVEGCADTVATAVRARWIWMIPTVGALAGLFVLLGQVLRRHEPMWRWTDAALGLGLLALVPVFHRWSIQVRTDQIALVGGVWGSVALLASRRRLAWAAAAGALFGIGLLGTPKLIYIGGLGGLLALGDLWLDGTWRWRREIARAVLAVLCLVLVVGAYSLVVGWLLEPPRIAPASQQLDTFAWYREIVGFRVYRAMLPTLVPHLFLGVLLLLATGAAAAGRIGSRRQLVLAWAVLALGLAVGLFHAAAFTYFWMTLGVFPAVALALALAPIRAMLSTTRMQALVSAGLWLILIAIAVPAISHTLHDSQAIQRRSLGFVDEHLAPELRGFQLDGALFCRDDPDPFPVLLREHVERQFRGDDVEQNVASMIREFRERPVSFIVGSHRMYAFPPEMLEFWFQHYRPYRGTVMLAGAHLRAPAGARGPFELIVGGRYRWIVPEDETGERVRINGTELRPGDTIELAAGRHEAEFPVDVSASELILAVDAPPRPAGIRYFFSGAQLAEITGRTL